MVRFNDIVDEVLTYNPDADVELLQRAYIFSAKAHKGQVRLSGEPYLIHPLETAYTLTKMNLDIPSIDALINALEQYEGTVIFISHDMQLVAEHADDVAVMSEGRIIFRGSPRSLFERADVLEQAALLRPPLAELAHRLHVPPLLTIDEWVDRLSDRYTPR